MTAFYREGALPTRRGLPRDLSIVRRRQHPQAPWVPSTVRFTGQGGLLTPPSSSGEQALSAVRPCRRANRGRQQGRSGGGARPQLVPSLCSTDEKGPIGVLAENSRLTLPPQKKEKKNKNGEKSGQGSLHTWENTQCLIN